MIKFIVILLFIAINALIDDWLYDHQYYDSGNHFPRFMIRVGVTVIIGIFIFDWKFILANGLVFGASYDYVLNYIRDLPLNHLGENWFDRFYSRIGIIPTIVLKVSFFLIGCVLLII